MREKPTGRPRGFGFVVFSDPSVLDRVLQDRHTIDGCTAGPTPVLSKGLLPFVLGVQVRFESRVRCDSLVTQFNVINYCDLCLIYGNESQHSRSSYFDIKMEINTNTLGMGIDDIIGDTQSPATESLKYLI
uniref:RRM domain-containing protein n=1 Tax=Quercus lobata TaxID=97700 RepID=A0A7N2M3Q6_QUELO